MSEERIPYYHDYGFGYNRLYLTGKCKRIDITANNHTITYEYAQARKYIFGIPLWTFWVDKDDIVWRTEKVTYYDCETNQPKGYGNGGAGGDF
jgi:hypothetical protein